MDIPLKKKATPGKALKLQAGLGLAAVLLGAWFVLPGSSNDAIVHRGDVVIATVERGELLKDIGATGTLVPSDLRWLESRVDGRIERILLEAGEPVEPDTLILELSNPTLSRNVEAARIDLEVLEAETIVLQRRLTRDFLAQQAVVADSKAQYENALFRLNANEELALKHVVSEIELNESRLAEQQYKARLSIEEERLAHLQELNDAEIAANTARIERARTQLALQEELLDSLQLRAGLTGVLQEVPMERGQQIGVGTLLARVAREDSLLAEMRVQESQAKDVRAGQKVRITANGQRANGIVSRVDPAVLNGVVIVDVRFDGPPLPGARPDLRVEGNIEIAQIRDALLLPRPVFSRENSEATVFRVAADGLAHKVPVTYGLGTIEAIQILEGLQEGDEVLVSDLTAYAAQDTLTLSD
ncbi:MAG: efflux RND transporter periplasmic adaptor subunit [Gammaproteobacteria bacterium]